MYVNRSCRCTRIKHQSVISVGWLADVGRSSSHPVRWSTQISDTRKCIVFGRKNLSHNVTQDHHFRAKTTDIAVFLSRWLSFVWDSWKQTQCVAGLKSAQDVANRALTYQCQLDDFENYELSLLLVFVKGKQIHSRTERLQKHDRTSCPGASIHSLVCHSLNNVSGKQYTGSMFSSGSTSYMPTAVNREYLWCVSAAQLRVTAITAWKMINLYNIP